MRFAADQLGAQLVDQAKLAQKTYERIGAIIDSDYEKLKVVGPNGGCNPNSPGCDTAYSYSESVKAAFSAAFYRDIQRVAHEKLLPLGYRVYQLKGFDRLARADRGHPPNIREWYHCGIVHPFADFPALASTSLLEELDPVADPLHRINLYDVFVLSAPQLFLEAHGTPPPISLLKRMFDPASRSNDPNAGGLGISPDELMRTAKHYIWNEVNDRPGHESCSFG